MALTPGIDISDQIPAQRSATSNCPRRTLSQDFGKVARVQTVTGTNGTNVRGRKRRSLGNIFHYEERPPEYYAWFLVRGGSTTEGDQ
jgi:hypothetical protein